MRPLTPGEIEILAWLIKSYHFALAVEWFGADALGPDALGQAVAAGAITEAEIKASGIGIMGAAYHVGAAMHQNPAAVLGQKAGDEPYEPPADLPDWQRRAAAAARVRGALMVVGLGNQTATSVQGEAVQIDEAQAKAYQDAIAESVARGIEAGETWKQTRGRIGEEALGRDYTRDLDRIAATEIQAAVNAGYADAVEADFGSDALVAVVPNDDACKWCLSSYLADGKPRIYKLRDLPQPSVNFRVKAADRVVTLPPAHPWCMPAGSMVLTDAGEVPIEDVTLGTLVMTRGGVFRRVDQLHRRLFTGDLVVLTVDGSTSLALTPNHKVVAGGEWVESCDVRLGQPVAVAAPAPYGDIDIVERRVTGIGRQRHDGVVYNLGIEGDDHSYVANAIVVSNCHCQLIYVEPGWSFDADWNLMPPASEENDGDVK